MKIATSAFSCFSRLRAGVALSGLLVLGACCAPKEQESVHHEVMNVTLETSSPSGAKSILGNQHSTYSVDINPKEGVLGHSLEFTPLGEASLTYVSSKTTTSHLNKKTGTISRTKPVVTKDKVETGLKTVFVPVDENHGVLTMSYLVLDTELNSMGSYMGVQLPDICSVEQEGLVTLKSGKPIHKDLVLCNGVTAHLVFSLDEQAGVVSLRRQP